MPAIEFYLRDCAFNRGLGGAAHIAQRALGVTDDGVVGSITKAALATAEQDAAGFLSKLRAAREDYEREVVGVRRNLWQGLVNRWNNALTVARTFPMTSSPQAAPPQVSEPVTVSTGGLTTPTAPGPPVPAVLPAVRIGMRGDRVTAWQSFLTGNGFDCGGIDGIFGEHARDATMQFQKKNGLAVDGVAGRQTLLKAASLGFELIEEPAANNTSSNFPPRPAFPPLTTNAQRAALFGHYDFVPAPTADDPEAIRILGGWQNNIVDVPIPQLRKALGNRAPQTMQFHRLAMKQLQGMWADWERAKLLDRVLVYDGSFVPRFVRGSNSVLSNHAFGSAFDINERFNHLGARPALVGEKGSVRELVPIANNWGFFWGGHYQGRKDGMHFEVAFPKS